MVSNSKVLTVSYGTFSCTLEGFDDSFDTMKAIAEYFRDLAADDRYFGAEPPTPDAEMLTRIAEREIERRVQARQEGGGIVLRAERPGAHDFAAAAAGAAASGAATELPRPDAAREDDAGDSDVRPEPAKAEDADAPDGDDDKAAPEKAREDRVETPPPEPVEETAEEEPTEEALPDDPPEPEKAEVEDDTDEIDQTDDIQEKPDAAEEVEDARPSDADAAETPPETAEEKPPLDPAVPDDSGDDALMQSIARLAEDDSDDAAAAPETEAAEAEEVTAESEPEAAEPAEDAPDSGADGDGDDSIAAKLARIRAVVSRSDEPEATADFSEDQHAEAFLAETAQDLEAALDLDAGADAATGTDQPQEAEPEAPARPRIVRVKRSEFDAALATGVIEAEDQPIEDATEDAVEETAEEPPAETRPDAPDAPLNLSPEDRVDEKEPEIEDADEPRLQIETLAGNTGLSEADEAELLAELAAVEAEINQSLTTSTTDDEDDGADINAIAKAEKKPAEAEGEPAKEVAETPADEASAETAPQEAGHAETLPDAGEDFDRILGETIDRFDEPDTKSRRETIATMRAAVAATKAERGSGQPRRPATDQARPYRDDLASVVRPRRRLPDSDRHKRPETEARSPLRLVASQRIDDKTGTVAPVRPRRVSEAVLSTTGETNSVDGFAEFAEAVGAHTLSELMEAAAAYLTFELDWKQFSRSQLLRHVRLTKPDDFDREESLRVLGEHLRNGTIEKTENGRFVASDRVREKLERAAG